MVIVSPPRPSVGSDVERLDARVKVSGEALYAAEYRLEGMLYAHAVGSTVARGRVVSLDVAATLAMPEVVGVLHHGNAPTLNDIGEGEMFVMQSDRVSYRGQIVAAVVARTAEAAREAAERMAIEYEEHEHDVVLVADHPRRFTPEHVAHRIPEVRRGNPEEAVARAPVVLDQVYRTSAAHILPLEPHATLASWEHGRLTVYESTQFPHGERESLAKLFGIESDAVRVISRYVGGGFGSKGSLKPQAVTAAMAAQLTGRPVRLALSRRQMFALTGYRGPTIQHVRLGAERDGRLISFEHRALAQTSTVHDFVEPCTTGTRIMYAAPDRFDTHEVARLDVPTPNFCRGPGEAPGFFALESALDELAHALGMDPVQLRLRNETLTDPSTGQPFSTRGLAECLTEGARRFGWRQLPVRRDGPWRLGQGMTSSMYPTYQVQSSARARAYPDGTYLVEIGAADVGTGSATVLSQVAADALEVELERVTVAIGDTALPWAVGAFASLGTASWSHAVHLSCRRLLEALEEHDGPLPSGGLVVEASSADELAQQRDFSRAAFGAQFAQVRVNTDTGEIRVDRLYGLFAGGQIINMRTARSQLVGGMTWGVSMALHEETVLDPNLGEYVNNDLAGYHVAAMADIREIEAEWLPEHDEEINPVGAKGIGEIGIVGTAAAIANAVFDATGIRIRELPIRLDRVLEGLAARA